MKYENLTLAEIKFYLENYFGNRNNQNVETLIKLNVLPLKIEENGTQILLTNNTHDYNSTSNIKYLFGSDIELINISTETYNELIDFLRVKDFTYSKVETKLKIFKAEANEDDSNLEAIRFLNKLIEDAINTSASDIHIEPQKDYIRVRYRLDGKLKVIHKLDNSLQSLIITRFKIISGLDISERRLPQDGRITFTFEGREIDLRISVMPTIYGEKIVIRVLDSHFKFNSLADLGVDSEMETIIRNSINRSNGLILVCGPTGSGKSTTIYSMLSILNNEDVNITTIEDPVEYKLDGVNQIQVNYKTGLEFNNTLNHVLRQDPDTLSIGEVRNEETVKIALRASITGHLVFSTVHSRSSVLAIDRLLDMNAESYLLSSALQLIISQRLILKLCNRCKQKVIVESEFFKEPALMYSPVGCEFCNDGYKDRIGVFELLLVDDKLKKLINKKRPSDEILDTAIENGFITLEERFKQLLLDGITSLEEVRRSL